MIAGAEKGTSPKKEGVGLEGVTTAWQGKITPLLASGVFVISMLGVLGPRDSRFQRLGMHETHLRWMQTGGLHCHFGGSKSTRYMSSVT